MDCISEIEMVFESYDCNNGQKTFFAVRKLNIRVLSWCKMFTETMPKGEEIKMSWENLLE